MFISQNQLVSELQCLSRIRVNVNGVKASDHDVYQFQTVTVLRYGLEADLSGVSCLKQCTHRRCIHNIQEVDLRKYAEDWKTLKLAYLSQIQVDPDVSTWPDFKRRVAGQLTNKWMLSTLANLYGNPKASLQWLAFDERLLLDTLKDLEPEIQTYLDFEVTLGGIAYPEPLMEALNGIISTWFHDFTLATGPVRTKFGPGSVADWRGRMPELGKALRCVWDARVVRDMADIYGIDPSTLMPGGPGNATYTNRIIFRPKNALAHRIISAEPCWLTWLQQGVKNAVFPYISRNPRMNTVFESQAISRRFALRGSIDGSFATVDFSSASDSVTTKLVDRLFAGTDLHDALMLTRSDFAEMPDGRICWLHKFAPMGSACCFFVMDVIFLSMCELAVRQTLQRSGRPSDYVVYGDDVIIRSDCYQQFSDLSHQLGFKLNKDKSYFATGQSHYYRESCGIEAYDGIDITPLRYSRFQEPLVGWEHPADMEYVSAAVDLLNRLQTEYAYYQTRSAAWTLITGFRSSATKEADWVWKHIMRIDESDWRAGQEGPMALVVPDSTATNYHCEHRWNRQLQRKEVRCVYWDLDVRPHWTGDRDGVKPVPTRKDNATEAALYLWCVKADADSPNINTTQFQDRVASVTGPGPHAKWRLGWFPE